MVCCCRRTSQKPRVRVCWNISGYKWSAGSCQCTRSHQDLYRQWNGICLWPRSVSALAPIGVLHDGTLRPKKSWGITRSSDTNHQTASKWCRYRSTILDSDLKRQGNWRWPRCVLLAYCLPQRICSTWRCDFPRLPRSYQWHQKHVRLRSCWFDKELLWGKASLVGHKIRGRQRRLVVAHTVPAPLGISTTGLATFKRSLDMALPRLRGSIASSNLHGDGNGRLASCKWIP